MANQTPVLSIPERQKPAPGTLNIDHIAHFVPEIGSASEVLAQLGGAAATAGDAELSASFAAASAAVRRGIVFAASLYI